MASRAGLAGLCLLAVAACTEQRTPGDDLFGTWAEVAPATAPGQQWTFGDDLTYDRSGPITDRGTFEVEGSWITLTELGTTTPQRWGFDYVATRDHWLERALTAVGEVAGRAGTWRGRYDDLDAAVMTIDELTLSAGGAAHLRRDITRPTSFERWEGDGSWADAATDASFTVTVTLRGPAGQTADVVERRWRLADAVGGPLYERVSF